jgi:hypothetical protein
MIKTNQKEGWEKMKHPGLNYLSKELREHIHDLNGMLKNGGDKLHHALKMDTVRFVQARIEVAKLIDRDFISSLLLQQKRDLIGEIEKWVKKQWPDDYVDIIDDLSTYLKK